MDDAGWLSFQYYRQSSKNSQKERTFLIKLREVILGECQLLTIKVGKLESEVQQLKKNQTLMETQARLQNENLNQQIVALTNQLEATTKRLTEFGQRGLFNRIIPELDMETASIAKATIKGNQVTADKGPNEWNPFFLTHKLEGR